MGSKLSQAAGSLGKVARPPDGELTVDYVASEAAAAGTLTADAATKAGVDLGSDLLGGASGLLGGAASGLGDMVSGGGGFSGGASGGGMLGGF